MTFPAENGAINDLQMAGKTSIDQEDKLMGFLKSLKKV
jgi:hypothetical protein